MPWGNEKHMRPVIAQRRCNCVTLRSMSYRWRDIAEMLGYGSLQHARIDWLRAQPDRAK